MTMCVTPLGDVIASGMQMLVMALSAQPQNTDIPHAPHVSHPHFNTYRGFASPSSYGNHSIIVPHYHNQKFCILHVQQNWQ